MDLYQIDMKTLMAAVFERLVMIEAGDLERDLLRAPAPTPSGLHAKLSRLVRAARDYVQWQSAGHSLEGQALEAAVEALAYLVVAGDHGEADADDEILLDGRLRDVLQQRYTELQKLYALRMDFTRGEIQRVHEELAKTRAAHAEATRCAGNLESAFTTLHSNLVGAARRMDWAAVHAMLGIDDD